MIAGDLCEWRADDGELRELKVTIEVEVVEAEEWEDSRVAALHGFGIDAVKLSVHQHRRYAAGPLVEIADHDARPRKFLVRRQDCAHQRAGLMWALEETCSEMDVEDVKNLSAAEFDVGAKAAPPFALAPGDVVIFLVGDGKPRQGGVSIGCAAMYAVLAEGIAVAGTLGDDADLRRRISAMKDLLKGD